MAMQTDLTPQFVATRLIMILYLQFGIFFSDTIGYQFEQRQICENMAFLSLTVSRRRTSEAFTYAFG
jgi:hypothetical protein